MELSFALRGGGVPASLALLLLVGVTSGVCHAAPTATVSGIVRDSQGVAQMGAVVEALANGVSVAQAFTDLYGRYRLVHLNAGRYQVRATAALYVPATRANLLLATGRRATVNLTLSALADTTAWLPAERRKPDDPGDDWTWTLRSAVNRPVLRVLGDGQVVVVSADTAKGPSLTARASLGGGDGGFGAGGAREVLLLDRLNRDGSDMVGRAELRTAAAGATSTELDAGYERAASMGGATRVVLSYQEHPELVSAGASRGLQVMRTAGAQRMKLGDSVDVEAGGTLYAVRANGSAAASEPFLRLTVHPGEVWAVQYRLASSRQVQGFDGLDSMAAAVPVAAMVDGRLRLESGRHQEIAISRRLGQGAVVAAIYRDVIERCAVGGIGQMAAADMLAVPGASSIVADTATGNFRLLTKGYATQGLRVTVSQPLGSRLTAAAGFDSGAGISTQNAAVTSLPVELAGLHPQAAMAATAAIEGLALRGGTKVRAAYRWQPRRLVTAVGPYEAFSDQGYLSFYVRQPLRWGNLLPPGLEATVDVSNLLAQGYQPFLSADGRTLFLAQTARTIQGGLSFSF